MKETTKEIENVPWYSKYAGQVFNTVYSKEIASNEILVNFPEGKYSIPKDHVELVGISDTIIKINEILVNSTKEKTISQVSEKNNGGSTDYYALPIPSYQEIKNIIWSSEFNIKEKVGKILSLCPQTINDLIEFKNMMPWQHEVIKSCYAINERAKKEGGSEERELNKQVYYINRRRKQLGLPVYKLED